jgi:hypothetical protein
MKNQILQNEEIVKYLFYVRSLEILIKDQEHKKNVYLSAISSIVNVPVSQITNNNSYLYETYIPKPNPQIIEPYNIPIKPNYPNLEFRNLNIRYPSEIITALIVADLVLFFIFYFINEESLALLSLVIFSLFTFIVSWLLINSLAKEKREELVNEYNKTVAEWEESKDKIVYEYEKNKMEAESRYNDEMELYKNQLFKYREMSEKIVNCDRIISDSKKKLNDLYSGSTIIPKPYRNIESVCYLYDFMSTSGDEYDVKFALERVDFADIKNYMKDILQSQRNLLLIETEQLIENRYNTEQLTNTLSANAEELKNHLTEIDSSDNKDALLRNLDNIYRDINDIFHYGVKVHS